MARQVLENGVILPAEYSDDWYDDMTSNLTKLDDVIGSDSEKLSSADVGAAALSNNYNDLDNLPTIPTVNDATLTIQKNGVNVQTFTANASSNVTANITVPTKTSDLTNDSNFVDTSNSAVASGITSAKVTSYDSHVADTDIHVTAADKNKWNNQTFVFRYSSTALVASSTNSNTLLDNTDNLKVGDKVIDSSGVLFSITAIDSVNSTFTVGSALIDLALDANVVHTSGNETISGDKVFNNRLIKNIDVVLGTAPSTGKFSTIEIADNNKSNLLQILGGVYANGQSYARFFVQNKTADDGTGLSPTGTLRGCGFNIILPAGSTSEGQGSITPRANKTTDFGLSGYQWRNLWCEKLYLDGTQLDPSAFALDNAVVHTSGDETISGQKVFSDINAISSSAEIGVSAGNNSFKVLDKNKKTISSLEGGTFSTGMAYSHWLVNNGSDVFNGVSLYQSSANLAQLRPYSSTLSLQLGSSIRSFSDCYTSKINGLEPSSLSLPSGNASDVIDISSYLVNLDGTDNTYVAPSNGWITINMNNCSGIHAIITGFWGDSRIRASAGAIKFLMPVLKNQTVTLTIHGGTINNARFIPCQGNV